MVLTDGRCQTEDMAGLSRSIILAALERAAAAGHVLDDDFTRARNTKHGTGVVLRCSCGWETTPQTKRARAIHRSMVHIGEVVGEQLVTFTGSVAGGVGASPDVPERSDDPTEEGQATGEGEPSSRSQPGTRATVAAG